ncbi:MAG: hypothetical protein K2G12_07590 [Prevotella sp.]|nr:hypothetical protein [Prevotella sp.]
MLILFLAMSSVGMAQVRISVADLKGTKWVMTNDDSSSVYEYTSDKNIWYDSYGRSHTYSYYFTDQPITTHEGSAFDHSKVGKGTKGCYLVAYNDNNHDIRCYTILSFNKEKMVTTMITENILGGWERIFHYVRIK